MSWRHHAAIARTSITIGFQEAFIRFSKLGFPVAHGKFGLQYEDYIYKFIVDARTAARSRGKKFSTISRVTFNTLFNINTRVYITVCIINFINKKI